MEKTMERRQDVGLKFIYGIAGGLVMFLLTLFFNHTYNLATEAFSVASTATKDVAVLQQCFKDIGRRLDDMGIDIKDIKRAVNNYQQ
jgi:hypothetical protein